MDLLPLSELHEGQSACVVDILPQNKLKARLQDLGLIKGTEVRCLQRSAYGDPVAFFFRGAAIALRQSDSSSVLVKLYQ